MSYSKKFKERGAIDPVTIIGVLFLLVTMVIATYVVADKKFNFNIFERAGVDGGLDTLTGNTSGRNIGIVGRTDDYNPQTNQKIKTPDEKTEDEGPPPVETPVPPTAKPSAGGCNADGAIYPAGVVAVYSSGNSDYRYCGSDGWTTMCPDGNKCELSDVTLGLQPIYLESAHQEAVETAEADCVAQGKVLIAGTCQTVTTQTVINVERDETGTTRDLVTYYRDEQNNIVGSEVTPNITIQNTQTAGRGAQIYQTTIKDQEGNYVAGSITPLVFETSSTVEKVDDGFTRDFRTIIRNGNTNEILNILTKSINTADFNQEPPVVSATIPRYQSIGYSSLDECLVKNSGRGQANCYGTVSNPSYIAPVGQVYNFAYCNKDGASALEISECNQKMSGYYTAPLLGRYLQAYAPQNVKYAWEGKYSSLSECQQDMKQYGPNAAASCNTYQPTKEQFTSSVAFGSALTAGGTLILATGGAATGALTLPQAIYLGMAASTTYQYGTTVDICVNAPDSPECKNSKYWSAVATLNILSSGITSYLQASRFANLARGLNATVNAENIYFDFQDIDQSCGTGQYASGFGCIMAYTGFLFDTGQAGVDIGLVNALTKSIDLSNIAKNPLEEINFSPARPQLDAPISNIPRGIDPNLVVDVFPNADGRFVVPNTSTTALAVAPHLDIAQADGVITATILDEIPARPQDSPQEIAGLLTAPTSQQPINVTSDFAGLTNPKVEVGSNNTLSSFWSEVVESGKKVLAGFQNPQERGSLMVRNPFYEDPTVVTISGKPVYLDGMPPEGITTPREQRDLNIRYINEVPRIQAGDITERKPLNLTYEQQGGKAFTDFAYLKQGSNRIPVGIKTFKNPLSTAIPDEIVGAQIIDQLGIGPRFYGIIESTDGTFSYVMDAVLGVDDLGPRSWWDQGTIDSLKEASSRLKKAGYAISDINYMITPAKKAIIIDPETLKPIQWFKDEYRQNKYVSYTSYTDMLDNEIGRLQKWVDYWKKIDTPKTTMVDKLKNLWSESILNWRNWIGDGSPAGDITDDTIVTREQSILDIINSQRQAPLIYKNKYTTEYIAQGDRRITNLLIEDEIANKIIEGKQVALFHEMRNPTDFDSMQRNGITGNYSVEVNGEKRYLAYFNILTPDEFLDTSVFTIINRDRKLKIFDARNDSMPGSKQVEMLISEGYDGVISQRGIGGGPQSTYNVLLFDGQGLSGKFETSNRIKNNESTSQLTPGQIETNLTKNEKRRQNSFIVNDPITGTKKWTQDITPNVATEEYREWLKGLNGTVKYGDSELERGIESFKLYEGSSRELPKKSPNDTQEFEPVITGERIGIGASRNAILVTDHKNNVSWVMYGSTPTKTGGDGGSIQMIDPIIDDLSLPVEGLWEGAFRYYPIEDKLLIFPKGVLENMLGKYLGEMINEFASLYFPPRWIGEIMVSLERNRVSDFGNDLHSGNIVLVVWDKYPQAEGLALPIIRFRPYLIGGKTIYLPGISWASTKVLEMGIQ